MEESKDVLKPSEVAQLIVQDCGLAEALSLSVCLSCGNRVLLQDSTKTATLFCRALYRDLEACVTRCTAFTAD